MASQILRGVALAALAAQAHASCAYNTHLHRRAEGGAVEVNTFGYSGAIGPLNWVSLDPAANQACISGTQQSPINMVDGVFTMVSAADLQLEIPDFTEGTEFENLGTTVEVIAQGGSMTFGGTAYELKQFHFHLPSEHLDNGTTMAMEMHMVWESAEEDIAVIGTYIDLAEDEATTVPAEPAEPAATETAPAEKLRRHARDLSRRAAAEAAAPAPAPQKMGVTPQAASAPVTSSTLETIFGSLDAIKTPGSVTETEPVVMSEIVEALTSGAFQNYAGSLTTPPCSEGVTWLVATQKLAVSVPTFMRVRDVIGFNARYAQNAPGEANLLDLANLAIAGNAGGAASPATEPADEVVTAPDVGEAESAAGHVVVEAPAAEHASPIAGIGELLSALHPVLSSPVVAGGH